MVRIVFLGDTHVGSRYAILPEDAVNPEDGSKLSPNQWQKELYRAWCSLANKYSPADIIVLMGDLIEGPQTKEKYGTLCIQNVQSQADVFVEMFRNTWRWKQLFVVRGTDYHVATLGMHAEEYIARMLNAVKIDYFRHSAQDIFFTVNNRKIHASHHVGFSRVPSYRFTPLGQQMWLLKAFDEYFGKVDIVARGHVHYSVSAQLEDMMLAFSTPSWQFPTPYQRKHNPAMAPSIGLRILEIDDDGDYRLKLELVKGFHPRTFRLNIGGDKVRVETFG